MLDATQELIIRKSLADTIATVSEVGFVQPSPLYCGDDEDFWATLNPTVNTKDEIDQTIIPCCWLYPISFEDVPDAGCLDKPLIRLTYEFYLFRQYGIQRVADRVVSIEIFDTELLAEHNTFVAAWLGIKNEFQGKRNLTGLTGFTYAKTNSIVQVDDIQNQDVCQFVNGIVGFSVRLRETIDLQVA